MEEVRRERLKLLRQEFGTLTALNEKLGLDKRDSTLSQILNSAPNSRTGKGKTMGSPLARKLESACGKEQGWMDTDPDLIGAAKIVLPAVTASAEGVTGTAPEVGDEPEFTLERPPTIAEAVDAIAEMLLHLDDDGRAMASTALSNLARNPERAAKAAETLAVLGGIHPREPTPPTPSGTRGKTRASQAQGKPAMKVHEGGGQKMQLDLPLKTVANPFDKSAAPPREREWYDRVKAAPKAAGPAKARKP